MSKLAMVFTPFLAVSLGLCASAQDTGQSKAKDGGKSEQGTKQTIKGTVAGVTVVGETMVNYESNRAAVAEFSYLTVLGSPKGEMGDAHGGAKSEGDKEKSADSKEDAKQAKSGDADKAAGKSDDSKSGQKSASSRRRRADVYLVAITPQTKLHTAGESGHGSKDASGEGDKSKDASSGEGKGHASTSFDVLELGDRVEIEFSGFQGQEQSERESKHGRHRTHRCVASSITILPDESGDDHGHDSASKSSEKSDEKK